MKFATPEWADAFRADLEGNVAYRKAASGWTHGPCALLVRGQPELGVSESALWLDLHAGRCRQAKIVDTTDAKRAPFCIEGNYADWKAVIVRQLDPIKAIISRRLKVSGSLFTLLRYVPAALELVSSAQRVPTEFPDEVAP